MEIHDSHDLFFVRPVADFLCQGFYLPTLLHESVGYDLQTSKLLAAVSGTVYLIAAFFSLAVIDRVGRRKYVSLLQIPSASISS